jgi:hypothetical protein
VAARRTAIYPLTRTPKPISPAAPIAITSEGGATPARA